MNDVSLFVPLFVNTGISYLLSMLWYSRIIFGKPWAKNHFGSVNKYEKTVGKDKFKMAFLRSISIVCSFLLNLLLILLVKNYFVPSSLLDVVEMSLVITCIYVFLELPHVGYESRSFSNMLIHTTHNFLQIFLPLLFYAYYYDQLGQTVEES